MTVETPIGDATRGSQDSKDVTIDVDSDSDDDPLHRRSAAGSGQAEGASKRQRGSSTRRGKVSPQEKVPEKSRSRSVRDGGRRRRRKQPPQRTDSLPRSRLRMNVKPANHAFKTFSSNSIVASAIVDPGAEQPTLLSTEEVAEELEPAAGWSPTPSAPPSRSPTTPPPTGGSATGASASSSCRMSAPASPEG